MLPLIALLQEIAEPTPFLPPIFPSSEISSFWETVHTIIPAGTQKVLLTLVGRKYSFGSSPLTSSITLTYLVFSIAPLTVAPLLKSPLLPPLFPSLAPGRCFRTLVLNNHQFHKPSLFLRSLSPTNVPFLQFSESSLG